MNLIQHEYQGITNSMLTNGDGDYTANLSNTQSDRDRPATNHCLANENLCANDSLEVCPTEYFPFINVMTDIDFSNPNNIQDQELHEKIQKHKKSSSFGFNSLQKRIEKVKNDIKNLTSKLKPENLEEPTVKRDISKNGHCNIATVVKEDETKSIVCVPDDNRTELNSSNESPTHNRFSELSENTQKILNRLHLTDDDEKQNKESPEDDDLRIEMEDDEIEFSFSIRSNSLLNDFLLHTPMPVIDEEEDEYSSSEESESISNPTNTAGNDYKAAPKSLSLNSFDITESGSYRTAIASSYTADDKQGSILDTEEYFSNFDKCSVSTGSLTESLGSQDIVVSGNSQKEMVMHGDIDLKDNCPHHYEENKEELTSEVEHSGWSTDDVVQSCEQNYSFYGNHHPSPIKSSLPNLLESSNCPSYNDPGNNILASRHINKSTDLDELLEQELTPLFEHSNDRLSQSLCDLFTAPPGRSMKPPRGAFQTITSLDNLIETDLDSGFVSVYKPAIEGELSPKVKFCSSMGNVSHMTSQMPLVNRLRQKAGSVSELRIAESLTKLNIPGWLQLHDDDKFNASNEHSNSDDNNYTKNKHSNINHNYSNQCLPTIRSPINRDRNTRPSQRKDIWRPQHSSETHTIPVIQSKPVVLPSQILKQNSQRKLTPINVCKARQFLLPNKVTINSVSKSIEQTC